MKQRLILFVHGLGGDGEKTWRASGHPGFPGLIARDQAVSREADVAYFRFPTKLWRMPFSSKAPGIEALAEGLRSMIENRFDKYESIALVCHSLGGLVARRYLVDEVRLGEELRVDKLLLYAVPNEGAKLARVAKHLSWRHNQLVDLCRDSEVISALRKDWSKYGLSDLVDVRVFVGGQDDVVDKESAISEFGKENVDSDLFADHVSVVKPKRPDDLSYIVFRRFVMGPTPVFLSVGGGRTEPQDRLVSSVKGFCLERGIDARTIDEYGSTNKQPLKDVEHRMNRCYGAVVIAFERTFIEQGVSRRGVGPPREKPLVGQRFPTVWNQIEAAMAYTRGLPLLVLFERGLEEEGMLESKYDWRVKRVDLEVPVVEDRDFLGIFEDWSEQVEKLRDAPLRDSMSTPG